MSEQIPVVQISVPLKSVKNDLLLAYKIDPNQLLLYIKLVKTILHSDKNKAEVNSLTLTVSLSAFSWQLNHCGASC